MMLKQHFQFCDYMKKNEKKEIFDETIIVSQCQHFGSMHSCDNFWSKTTWQLFPLYSSDPASCKFCLLPKIKRN